MIRNIRFLLFSLMIVLAIQVVNAQTLIINTPSTDVVPEKKVYVEFDFIGHLASYQNGGFQTYVPRVVYGTGKGVEIGLNAAWSKTAVPDQPVEIQPNVKWQFYKNEKRGIAMSGGGAMFITVANRTGADNFGMLYSNISKKVAGAYGPRITGGGYGLVGRADGQGNKGGAMVGFEQPLHKKVSWSMTGSAAKTVLALPQQALPLCRMTRPRWASATLSATRDEAIIASSPGSDTPSNFR